VHEALGVAGDRVARRGVQLRPGIARGDVDRGVLPERALGALQTADVEAVDADDLAGL
jgi:hypothetical protein